MKKVLLATTALGVFTAGTALAAGPTVTVGGHADFQAAIADQDGLFESTNAGSAAVVANTRDTRFRQDAEVHFKIDGTADNGIGYGGVLELITNQNGGADDASGDVNTDKSYIYLESGLGRAELGSNASATQALKVDASSFARGTGGIAGDFYKFIDLGGVMNTAGTVRTATGFIVTPDLPSVALPGARQGVDGVNGTAAGTVAAVTEDANKITYYTPRIQGFQGGISYTPDAGDLGNAAADTGEVSGDLEEVWNLGVNYEGEYNNVGIAASIVGEWADKEKEAVGSTVVYDDSQAYEFGLALNYAGFTIGGSWADIEEYGAVAAQNDEGEYWTAGAAYEYGPFAASVTYLDSENGDDAATGNENEFQNLVVGADYQLAPGLVPYVEVSFFDTDDGVSTTIDNDGTLVLLGTGLNF